MDIVKRAIAEEKDFLREVDDRMPTLAKYSRNLNRYALKRDFCPIYSRDNEIEQIKTTLLRKTKPNTMLTGEPGCGKTAIVEGLAHNLVNERIALRVEHLKDTNSRDFSEIICENENRVNDYNIIYDLNISALVGGTKYRGEFEARYDKITQEIIEMYYAKIVIFIDELHLITTAGAADGASSLAQLIKPMLARGDIRVIGAVSTDEANLIKKDRALARRFRELEVSQIKGRKAEECLESIAKDYSKYHEIGIEELDFKGIMDIIYQLMPDSIFPDNAINILDETMALARRQKQKSITMSDIKRTLSSYTGLIVV